MLHNSWFGQFYMFKIFTDFIIFEGAQFDLVSCCPMDDAIKYGKTNVNI